MLVSDAHRAALLAHTLPRATRIPNRLDPFDTAAVCNALRLTLTRAIGGCAVCKADANGAPVPRKLAVGAHSITIFEQAGDYATRLWLSSMTLSEWLTVNNKAFAASTVLEVGCGTGLCSLALAASSNANVIASDVSSSGLEMVGAAARSQGLTVECIHFDICSDAPLPAQVEWLIASDVLYTPQLAIALAERCIEISRRGGRAVVADPGRPTRRLFQSVLERDGFRSAFVPMAKATMEGLAIVLLHVEGERSVSQFEAHAELEG